MPTYEYQCKSCEHRFEVWQKMTDESLTICPKCKGVIRRVLFPAGIVFKGSGFYKTDHGSGAVVSENNQNQPEDAKENKSDPKEGATSKETTSDAKANASGAKPVASGSDKAAAAD